MLTLPKINRRTWIALWAQDRRRSRVRAAQATLLPAPVLRAAHPDLLQWDWDCANPYQWNVYLSLDGGVTFFMPGDYWVDGEAREFSPDGGSELYFIVGVDANGREITQRSNIVRPDDAIAPPVPVALLPGLLAYWPMDEDTGLYNDASGNQNDLTLNGQTLEYFTGKLGTAIVSVDYTSSLTAPVALIGNFSISFWIKTAQENFFTCLSQATSGCIGYLFYGHSGGFSFQVYTGDAETNPNFIPDVSSGSFGPVGGTISDGEWHHVVGVLNGQEASLYIDGVLADAVTGEFPLIPSANPMMLFDNNTCLGQTVIGSMDEVGVWQRALSAEDVGQLFNNGNGLAYGNF